MAVAIVAASAISKKADAREAASAALTVPSVPRQIVIDGEPMTLSFSDEFDDLKLWDGRSGVWRTNYGYFDREHPGFYSLVTNEEKQLYVDPTFRGTAKAPLGLDPFSVRDGVLTIRATRLDPALTRYTWGYRFASGLITTKPSFSQTYGYFEMRAQLPRGKGFWPAFWLARADGKWPPEIDVVEMLGHEIGTVYTVVHFKLHGEHRSTGGPVAVTDVTRGFHTYGVKWTREEIVWYVDGARVFRTSTPADMDGPMYLLANLAVGGKWPGDPDDATPFPAEMKIDYIRAYALNGAGADRSR
jgi:beta-glucanase (GH16 family)